MPTQLQWLRARAIHAYFKDREGVDCPIHRLVFTFCDCPPQIFSYRSGRAFAVLTDWGSVVTWGDARCGGDSSDVAAELTGGVQTVVGSPAFGGGAFAAVKVDGSVVTWGDPDGGGDSSRVAAQLSSGVKSVVANSSAFAALKFDGSVVTWGDRCRERGSRWSSTGGRGERPAGRAQLRALISCTSWMMCGSAPATVPEP